MSNKNKRTIAIVNSSPNSENISFDFGSTKTSRNGKQWLIHHTDPEIYNEPGKIPNVSIVESALYFKKHSLRIPGYSNLMVKRDIGR